MQKVKVIRYPVSLTSQSFNLDEVKISDVV